MAQFMNLGVNYRRQKRLLPLVDHLSYLEDEELYQRYRFDRGGIRFLTDLIENDIKPATRRSRAVPPDIQVLVALRHYATGDHQSVIGDTFNLSQQTVSDVTTRVTEAFLTKVPQFIKFPTGEELDVVKNGFFAMKGKLPGIVGCIDCTHVKFTPTGGDRENFKNRKGQYSVNIQAVCDHRAKFTHITANWPGSTHDSFILRQSSIFADFESGRKTGILLGDSGYPLKPWLLTPFSNPSTPSQVRYNSAHTTTRVLVENSFGRLKRRFALLHVESRKDCQKLCKEFTVCAMLHNIATDRRLPVLQEWQVEDDDQPPRMAVAEGADGKATRNAIVEAHFN